jgi:hypothetical protein
MTLPFKANILELRDPSLRTSYMDAREDRLFRTPKEKNRQIGSYGGRQLGGCGRYELQEDVGYKEALLRSSSNLYLPVR